MPRIPFGEWRPDVADQNEAFTRVLQNVVPRADGYGPFKDIAEFTDALPADCRGYFVAYATDSTVRLFAGTADRLYLLDNTTLAWTDVSKGATTYSALASDSNWMFAQFGSVVVATQRNTVMQAFTIGSSTAFADLAGSPPQAGYIAVIGPFLVACDLLSTPYRVHWSALNNITIWSSGNTYAGYQDVPDGGRVRSVCEMGADVGLACQDNGARRMAWVPGSDTVWQIDRIPDCPGILAPYSLVTTQGGSYYFSTRGFVRVDPTGAVTPIGEERVNRTVLGQHGNSVLERVTDLAYDPAYSRLFVGAVDPQTSTILWAYKTEETSEEVFTRGIVYHTTLQRWAPISLTGQFIGSVARPGITVEGLDYVAPGAITITGAASNGSGLVRITVGSTSTLTTGDVKTIAGVGGTTEANGTWTITVINGTTFDLQGSTFANAYTSGGVVAGSIDAMTFPWDDYSSASLPTISAFNTDGELGFFAGATLEATLESAEQSIEGSRLIINGIWPATDADTVYGRVVTRAKLHGTDTEGTENAINDDGFVPLLSEGRYVRGRVRIPAGTTWTYASGFNPEFSRGGRY